MKPPEPPDLLTSREVAARFRVCQRTVDRWVRNGKLTPVWTPGRQRRYRRADIDGILGATAFVTEPSAGGRDKPRAVPVTDHDVRFRLVIAECVPCDGWRRTFERADLTLGDLARLVSQHAGISDLPGPPSMPAPRAGETAACCLCGHAEDLMVMRGYLEPLDTAKVYCTEPGPCMARRDAKEMEAS
jgi:excisionase family DNA binding protein